jgi:hypothetical protein
MSLPALLLAGTADFQRHNAPIRVFLDNVGGGIIIRTTIGEGTTDATGTMGADTDGEAGALPVAKRCPREKRTTTDSVLRHHRRLMTVCHKVEGDRLYLYQASNNSHGNRSVRMTPYQFRGVGPAT